MSDKKYDLPAMPFYWGDWFKALDVQALPREIKCTWFEMLGRMWESEKRGYLSINGEKMSERELAISLGFGDSNEGINECKKHIDFLEKKRIFSRNKVGIIYNRKMVKDIELSKKRAKAGKKGMNQRYKKDGICYNKTANKKVTNTEIEIEYENEYENEYKGGVERGETALNMWNDFAVKNDLATVMKLTPQRKKHLNQRLSETEFNLEKILAEILKSDFLKGNNDRGWKVSFDFIINSENNYLKILEGKYKNGTIGSRGNVTKSEIESELAKAYGLENRN